MVREKIAITLTSFAGCGDAPLELLAPKRFDIVRNSLGRTLESEETFKLCGGCAGIIAGTESYDRPLLERLSGLKVISRCGAGVDNIDRNAAADFGIKIFNTPDGPTLAVAELTVGLILSLLRGINGMNSDVLNGKWKKMMGNLLSQKKIGIVGFGRIGRKVAELLKPFTCEIAYADPLREDAPPGVRRMGLKELLGWANIVTLHISGREMVLREEELKSMTKGSWLINTSRGSAIDERALHDLLKERRISGAALDVFDREPYTGRLKELDNVILTPHIGSYAKEARLEMELDAVKNLLKGLEE